MVEKQIVQIVINIPDDKRGTRGFEQARDVAEIWNENWTEI